jgi:hypothetical protein
MKFGVDTKRIAKSCMVPFEEDDGIYGVAWELNNGWSGAQRIGTKEEAEAALKEIRQERPATVIPLRK